MKRVVITGMGAITAAGPTVGSLMDALRENRTCIGPLDLFPTGDTPVQIAGQVREIPSPDSLGPKALQPSSAFTRRSGSATCRRP